MVFKDKVRSKIKYLTHSAILRANYLLKNFDEVIWLIGDARSGTTWVSDLIASTKSYRYLFEPFHPNFVHEMKQMEPHQFIRPGDSNERLLSVASSIFKGQFRHERVDLNNHCLLYDGLLIKDIFANLLCYWAVTHFPKVRPVLLIRNPFAVAASKNNKRDWFWANDPSDLLRQPDLYDDYLYRYKDLIKKVSQKDNFLLNQILTWSIINYIPLQQFTPGSIHICFYEQIYANPGLEISKIVQFVKGTNHCERIPISDEVINRSSRFSDFDHKVSSHNSPVSSWKNKIPANIIDEGIEILQHFGFDHLYNDNSLPDINAIQNIHGDNSNTSAH